MFQAPQVGDGRNLQRYRCGACHFVFTAPDRRLLSREERDARDGLIFLFLVADYIPIRKTGAPPSGIATNGIFESGVIVRCRTSTIPIPPRVAIIEFQIGGR